MSTTHFIDSCVRPHVCQSILTHSILAWSRSHSNGGHSSLPRVPRLPRPRPRRGRNVHGHRSEEVEAGVVPFLFFRFASLRSRESWCRSIIRKNLSSRVDVGWQQEQDDSGRQSGRNPRCPPIRARRDLVGQGQASTDQTR